jgi:hypothetical protein
MSKAQKGVNIQYMGIFRRCRLERTKNLSYVNISRELLGQSSLSEFKKGEV